MEAAVAAPEQSDDVTCKGVRAHRRRHLRPTDTADPLLSPESIGTASPLAEVAGVEIVHKGIGACLHDSLWGAVWYFWYFRYNYL